jgi:signal peptidase I
MIFISRFKVEGHSMEPVLKNGSFFIVSSLPYLFINPTIGDIIIFKSENKIIVKSIYKIENGKYYIQGINKKDSKKFNSLEKTEILGKLIFRISN